MKMGDREEKMKVTTGIKQGCTATIVLFKLITFEIMRKLDEEGDTYEIDGIRINSLFFADDSLLIGNTVEKVKRNIKIVKEISKFFGLEINEKKSQILVYKGKCEEKEIEGIEIVKEIKYLGMNICDGKDIFKLQKRDMINRAKWRMRETFSVIEKSCNRVLVGKTYWKCGVLPGILKSAEVMNFPNYLVEELQKQENKVYRIILGATGTTPLVTLRGEIGASEMKSRFIKDRLLFTKNIMESKNGLVRKVLDNVMKDKKNSWKKKTDEYMKIARLNLRDLEKMSKRKIKKKIYELDTRWWREELETKTTLEIYRECKQETKEEIIYNNGEASRLLFRARSNTMALNDRFRHDKGENKRNTGCPICGAEYENLEHFVLRCPKLDSEREGELIRNMRGEGDKDILCNLLFRGGRLGEVGVMIQKMWRVRKYWVNRKVLEGGGGEGITTS